MALVRSDGKTIDEAGKVATIAATHPDAMIYADRAIASDEVIRGRGSFLRWNETPYRWEVDDRSVILLGNYPGDGPDVLGGLIEWRDWLASYGARASSPRQASRSLLRATLRRPLYLDGGAPTLGEVVGGRQAPIRPPGHYGAIEIWDMEAAYARTLGELTYGGSWHDVGPLRPSLDSEHPALCHARVRVPKTITIGPLPRMVRKRKTTGLRRLMPREYPTGATISGVWSFDELRVAERAGCSVEIDRSWIMDRGLDPEPFRQWWYAIREGREMTGYARTLAKITGNVLWGTFIASGARTRLTFAGGERSETAVELRGHLPTYPALAEIVCARVRSRLYSELLEPWRADLISVHTDGGIVDGPVELGEGWRMKGRADALTYLGPQAYSYRVEDDTTYVVSGVPPDAVVEVFGRIADYVFGAKRRVQPHEVAAFRAIREVFPGVTFE
jgi:hypothetical protein